MFTFSAALAGSKLKNNRVTETWMSGVFFQSLFNIYSVCMPKRNVLRLHSESSITQNLYCKYSHFRAKPLLYCLQLIFVDIPLLSPAVKTNNFADSWHVHYSKLLNYTITISVIVQYSFFMLK